MTVKKYALLDTDFISKMFSIHKDETNRLIDRIMELPGYQFCCHEQVRKELLRHNISGSPEWLQQMIESKKILCYTDEMILDEMASVYAKSAIKTYSDMLKKGCDAYRAGCFEENFPMIRGMNMAAATKESFIQNLRADSDAIGDDQNLGELKTYVLLQMLEAKHGGQVYVFCSDDRNARSGIISIRIGQVRCISVLSSFLRLNRECGFSRDEAGPYIQSYLELCRKSGQTTFKIQDASKEQRMRRVPCEQVFEEMFDGKLEELQTGNLRYLMDRRNELLFRE